MVIWKPIEGFNRYEISNEGDIRRESSHRVLKSNLNRDGYLQFIIYNNQDKRCNLTAHRLVCITFHGLPPSDLHTDVNHKDGNKQNNHYLNLEWSTAKENKQHANDNGLVKSTYVFETASGKLLYSIEAVGKHLGVSKSKAFKLISSGNCSEVKLIQNSSFKYKKSTSVYLLDYANSQLNLFENIQQASLITGINRNSLDRAIKNKLPVNGVVIWSTSDSDWATWVNVIDEDQIEKSIDDYLKKKEMHTVILHVKNYVTGEVRVFNNRVDVANFVGVTEKQLDTHLYNKLTDYLKGCIIIRSQANTHVEFPLVDVDAFNLSLVTIGRSKNPIKVITGLGDTSYYVSLNEYAKSIGIKSGTLLWRRNNGKLGDVEIFDI